MRDAYTPCEELGHDYLFCCSRTADDDEGVIIEHFVCYDCHDDFEE
jgi:hypothetical protein